MPRLSVWSIRTAMLYLAAGFLWGALMLLEKGVPIAGSLLRLLPMHVEFVLIGWTLQLAMGVAFWILPRFSQGPAHGDERLGWLAYGLLNVGVLAAGVGQWLGAPALIPLLGRIAELLAAISFALQAWPRVKPVGA
jgi:cbb3-type cytochrome oxidase subunit 1